jgi:hypothetical protein
MNVGGIVFVCLYICLSGMFPIFAQLQMDREGNRRENADTNPESLTTRNVGLSACIRWAYGVQERVSSEN